MVVVVVLLYGLYLLTFVISNFMILRLNYYDESEGDWQLLEYVLDIQSFVFNKLREDGTLVLKHVVGM
jgi:hypothetical protein